MNVKPLRTKVLALALLVGSAGFALADSTATYTYDVFGRVKTVTATGGDTTSYTYDNADNRTQKVTASAAAPVTSSVSTGVPYNTATVIALSVTGNYTSVAVASGPSHGSTSVSGTTITYTPATNYTGSDSFTYTATNSSGTSSAATASLQVGAAVPPPTVANVSATVPYNTAMPITLDVSGTYTSVAVASGPSHGTTTINGATITYTPTTSYSGSDSFTYTATNAGGTSSAATASMTVLGANFNATVQVTGSGPVNLRTLANAANYNGAQNATIIFEVGNGVTIMGDPGGVAMDTGTWPGGYTTTLMLTVKTGGKIYGGGGTGGAGGAIVWSEPPTSGTAGGDAIYARVPMSITVQSGGAIAGGGQGGEGGIGADWWDAGANQDYYLGGGGGGGGFPNGPGGPGGVTANPYFTGFEGNPGSDGTTGGGGAGGMGQDYNLNFASSGGTGGGPGLGSYAIRKNGNVVSLSNSGTVSGTVN